MRREEGSIAPLTIVLGLLVLAVVLATAALTDLHLTRMRLLAVADAASTAAAESFAFDAVRVDGGDVHPVLEPHSVRRAAEASVASAPTDGLEGVRVLRAGTEDGRTAEVELVARWSPPVVSFLVPDGVEVGVSSTARTVFR